MSIEEVDTPFNDHDMYVCTLFGRIAVTLDLLELVDARRRTRNPIKRYNLMRDITSQLQTLTGLESEEIEA